jgi:hypothetical protein
MMPKTLDLFQFLIAVPGWMNQQQQHAIEYLQEESRIIRAQLVAAAFAPRSLRGTGLPYVVRFERRRRLGWTGRLFRFGLHA